MIFSNMLWSIRPKKCFPAEQALGETPLVPSDARYTDLARELSCLISKTINEELVKYRWRKDAKTWRHPDGSVAGKEELFEPDTISQENVKLDERLRRLVMEAEM